MIVIEVSHQGIDVRITDVDGNFIAPMRLDPADGVYRGELPAGLWMVRSARSGGVALVPVTTEATSRASDA